MSKKKIAVGLSGGIDSSFAAYQLKNEGWQVVGVSLKFSSSDNRCCDLDSMYQAKHLCDSLDIPHHVFDVKQIFKQDIIDYFIGDYLNGVTPNPCVFCNKILKLFNLNVTMKF